MSLNNLFHPTQVKTDKSLICEEVIANSRAKIYIFGPWKTSKLYYVITCSMNRYYAVHIVYFKSHHSSL